MVPSLVFVVVLTYVLVQPRPNFVGIIDTLLQKTYKRQQQNIKVYIIYLHNIRHVCNQKNNIKALMDSSIF